ncbi:MAG: PfkB family carbohydrate kinase [Dehalococcoidia bacterium]
MDAPRFLAVGHVVLDRTPRGVRWGGAATYAALAAARWGVPTALLTAGNRSPALEGVAVHCKPSPLCTTFENRYSNGTRLQRLLGRAAPLEPEDLPTPWKEAGIVLLAPVAQEVSPSFSGCFDRAILGAAPQGWLRRWTPNGLVHPSPLPDTFPLTRLHALIASQEDVDTPTQFARWAEQVPLVVMTRGREGAVLWERGNAHLVPTAPVEEVDPTGAGDVFAAIFLLRLWETGSAWEAALWASAAGALCVQKRGLAGVPTRGQVARLLSSQAWQGLRKQ